jgi:hypothetical protein
MMTCGRDLSSPNQGRHCPGAGNETRILARPLKRTHPTALRKWLGPELGSDEGGMKEFKTGLNWQHIECCGYHLQGYNAQAVWGIEQMKLWNCSNELRSGCFLTAAPRYLILTRTIIQRNYKQAEASPGIPDSQAKFVPQPEVTRALQAMGQKVCCLISHPKSMLLKGRTVLMKPYDDWDKGRWWMMGSIYICVQTTHRVPI